MDLVVRKTIAQKTGFDAFEPWGIRAKQWSDMYGADPSVAIDMAHYEQHELETLRELLARYPNVRGTNVLIHDIDLWLDTLRNGVKDARARTVRQFKTILEQFMLVAPRHHIYKRLDENSVLCYLVNGITYHPPQTSSSGGRIPAFVRMKLVYSQFGSTTETSVDFGAEDCQHIPVSEALLEQGYVTENKVLREEYEHHYARYQDIHPRVGKQYLASGFGKHHNVGSSWDRDSYLPVQLDRWGTRSRVVVDVWDETGQEQSARSGSGYNRYYWKNVTLARGYDPETDSDDTPLDEDRAFPEELEVPVHPWIVIFHLQKHLRLRAHVAQLEEYEYDEALADKLVLPRDQKALVKLLIETKGGMFQDIVQGKGGGAVILLSGAPGTGKTLTAEVYAESEQRPLYSVQCSQLGMDAQGLEKALMVVFDRARRWNAVLLLDEADVYVHERGNSMQQNAIVGVFLRVLEYQNTILFLTTNRPEDVDDAIASRCIARIAYKTPSVEDAARIWRVLVDGTGYKMSDATISQVTEANPTMTGRDIKNILKLAGLMEQHPEEGITADMVAYVQQFKPTGAV